MSAVVVGFGPYRSSSTLMRRQDMAAMTQVFVELVADVRRKVMRQIRGFVSKWSPSAYRLGFKVDIVGFGSRASRVAEAVIQRLRKLIRGVAKDVALKFECRSVGDDVVVLLPPDVTTEVLPDLLDAFVRRLREDNETYKDRLRLRMSVGLGTVNGSGSDIGGELMVELARLNECDVLRNAVIEYDESDLVALISDKFYEDARKTGWSPVKTRQVTVKAKEYSRPAWLWISELESR